MRVAISNTVYRVRFIFGFVRLGLSSSPFFELICFIFFVGLFYVFVIIIRITCTKHNYNCDVMNVHIVKATI